ncbi:perlucin-like [Anastrepha obliqua]|uniref:perlucin-like n=1 Tax=Anastrepha obliqua TaxID=95512 RepID=UPI00240987AF|nr:perlucin-like [Anastrepha obliqua]
MLKQLVKIFTLICVSSTGSLVAKGDESSNNRKIETLTVEIGGNIYLIWNDEKLSWWAARDFCTERQMKLVSLQTEEKSKQLNDFLQAHNLVDSPELGNDFIYWTSGTDQKHDGKFVWNGAENEEFTFTNWLPGMPDNWRGDEHCVEIGFKELGKWNDNRCRYHRHFICEVSHLVNAGIVKNN